MSKPTLWHCHNSRSLRPLWTMEEMGIDYDVVCMPFPPRLMHREYLQTNVLGTVPFFIDGDSEMTESTAICHYLVERYQARSLSISVDHPEYADFLNWLYHSDATLTFPQTIVMRYTLLEPQGEQMAAVVRDYGRWYIARLRRLDGHIKDREFLCDGRFTIADIAVTYALYLGSLLGLSEYYQAETMRYLERMQQRPAFQRAWQVGAELNPFKGLEPIHFDLYDDGQ